MDIDDEIRARVSAARLWDPSAKLGDFQIRATENGYVLINLKTGHAQFIFDESSDLEDLQQLFPNVRFGDFSRAEDQAKKSSWDIIAI